MEGQGTENGLPISCALARMKRRAVAVARPLFALNAPAIRDRWQVGTFQVIQGTPVPRVSFVSSISSLQAIKGVDELIIWALGLTLPDGRVQRGRPVGRTPR